MSQRGLLAWIIGVLLSDREVEIGEKSQSRVRRSRWILDFFRLLTK